MPATFCIPTSLAAKLKEGAREGKIQVAQMYEMTSQERQDLFAGYVDQATAMQINAAFETAISKKTLQAQKRALERWAEATFVGKDRVETKKDILTRIKKLDELGALNPENTDQFLQDLVAVQLGVTIRPEEAQKIAEFSKRLDELSSETTEWGTPTIEYFKARRETENYLDSLVPNSQLRVGTSIIGRGSMLLSFKSPFLNIISNSVQAFTQATEKRLANRKLSGANGGAALKYINFVRKVYAETGYDVSRMESLVSERKVLGEEYLHSQGSGVVRKVGRFYEDLVFKKLMGAPDVAFSAIAFADSANIASQKLAMAEGYAGQAAKDRALAIFKDATRIDPLSPQGQMVRDQARADAEYATYTNDSVYSDVALGIRKLFNSIQPDLRIGDQMMPFVKTPANVIGAGLDSSGITIAPSVAIRMVKMLKAIKSGDTFDVASKENFKGFGRQMIRAGLGTTFAFLISGLFEPEDFIGEYPTSEKERQLLDLGNATTNSVKIGGKWISLDYFGVIGSPLVGMLYAKKYGNNLPNTIYQYAKGVGIQSAKIPGFSQFYDTVKSVKEAVPNNTDTIEQNIGDVIGLAIDYARSRTIPGVVYDIAKGTDTVDRKTSKDDPLSRVKSAIPFLRQTLPVRETVLGEAKDTEGLVSTLLFGSRIKTASDSKVVQELQRLDRTGNLPSIGDVTKTSDRVKTLKNHLSEEEFNEAISTFGRWLREDIEELMSDPYYLDASDEYKKKDIERVRENALEDMLEEYGYFDIPLEE